MAGVQDYMDLFTPSASWANAASHVRVFKLSNIIVFLRRIPGTPSDDEWRQVFADLERRGIDVAMEWGPLTPEGCGAGIEGFDGASALQMANKIKRLGGKLKYIAMEAPAADLCQRVQRGQYAGAR
jgi:hypothetical protein